MKRFCEEKSWESDVEELIDVGKEENYCHVSSSISATATPHVLARKKRRGIIEKRRRDRINNSLSELRRLVPTDFEKQGTSKPEKAEILQMTVEHLKLLHATGGKGYPDPRLLAVDYRSVGFKECLAEVMTYLDLLDQREGSHGSDPLKDRLVSHLTNYVSDTEPTPPPDRAWPWAWPWPCHPLTTLLPRALEVARLPRGDLAQRDPLPTWARGRPALGPGGSVSSPARNPRLQPPGLTPSLCRAWPGLASSFPGVRANAVPDKASLPCATTCPGMNSPSLSPSSRLHNVRAGAPAALPSSGLFQPTSPFRLHMFEQTRRSPGARKPNRSWTTEIGAF